MPIPEARILVATDLSDSSNAAVLQADAYAASTRGRLGVCHVLPSSGVHMLFPQQYASEAIDDAALEERACEVIIERVSATTGRAPTAFETFIERGSPAVEILSRANAWKATLLVVGAHEDEGGVSSFFSGVAETLVREAPCSVLVSRHLPARGLVVCATDLAHRSLHALEAAADEARVRGAKLVVLHVIDQGIPLTSLGHPEGMAVQLLSPDLRRELRDAAKAEIEAALARLDAYGEPIILEGSPVDAILDYTEKNEPELVVLASHGGSGLLQVLIGGAAAHVARAARASVLVTRARASAVEAHAEERLRAS
jgi:nucleotide-binding universal stress UspA family protein